MDHFTCDQLQICSLELMERAGSFLYLSLIEDVGLDKDIDNVTIISGVGNNGGDGFVVGINLLKNYYNVQFVVVGDLDKQTEESKEMLKRVLNLGGIVFFINDKEELPKLSIILSDSTVLVDAIFGIGLTRNVKGIYLDVIKLINRSAAHVCSVDIPSGIKTNNGKIAGIAVSADYTLIVQNYKIGNLLNDAMDYHGKSILLDIGILSVVSSTRRFLLQKEEYMYSLPKRLNNTHKYNFGNVLVIGGSNGTMGAPVLAAYAALRTGSGLSSIAYNNKYLNNIMNLYPEVMSKTYGSIEELIYYTYKKNVIVFGPGLGRNDDISYEILQELLRLDKPLVIDADGMYYLKSLLGEIKNGKNIVITPHYGELAMLLDIDTEDIIKDSLKYIEQLTKKYKFTIVLKGPCTVIANKDVMYFSNYGNPGMATAGSGDVLSGIIASIIGKGYSLIDACKQGVLIHSLAGGYAKELYTEESLIATDIIKFIPKVYKDFEKE